jgi:hypothetical protein
MKRGFAVALSCAMTIGVGAGAQAQEVRDAPLEAQYTLEGNLLRITRGASSTVVDLGCAGRSLLRTTTELFVACGSAGVVELDLADPVAPQRTGTMRVDGDATGLFVHDGVVWVEVAHVDARPVRTGAASPVSEQPAPASTAAPPRRSSVPVAWAPARSAPSGSPAPAVDEGESAGAAAKEAPSIVAPARQGGLWEMAFLTSVFVPFGNLGIGQLGSASVAYRFEAPLVLRAELAPFGFAGPATTNNSPGFSSGGGPVGPGGFPPTQTPPQTPGPGNGGIVSVFAAHLLFGLDTQFLEVALGLGGATVNENGAFRQGGGAPQTGAVSIAQATRIGARDGLALNMESSAIALNSKFDLGYFVMSAQIPVSAKAMLVIRGGGGNVGFAYGDLGVRVLVHGNGGKHTLALTGFAGGAMIGLNLCSSNPDPPFTTACNTANLAGPSLGGAVEWKQ